jgi:hypothetical protein
VLHVSNVVAAAEHNTTSAASIYNTTYDRARHHQR